MTDPITDPEPMRPDVHAEAEQRLGLVEAIEREIERLDSMAKENARVHDSALSNKRGVGEPWRAGIRYFAQMEQKQSLERILKDWRNE